MKSKLKRHSFSIYNLANVQERKLQPDKWKKLQHESHNLEWALHVEDQIIKAESSSKARGYRYTFFKMVLLPLLTLYCLKGNTGMILLKDFMYTLADLAKSHTSSWGSIRLKHGRKKLLLFGSAFFYTHLRTLHLKLHPPQAQLKWNTFHNYLVFSAQHAGSLTVPRLLCDFFKRENGL